MNKKIDSPIYFASPSINQDDMNAVTSVLQSGNLSYGPEVENFENALSQMHGGQATLAVNNCTSALHAIFLTCLHDNFFSPADEILIPAFTFVSPINIALMTGLKVKLVDVCSHTFMPKVEDYEAARTNSTKGIVVVHIFGHPAPMTEIMLWAKSHNLIVIEDVAESFGASVNGKLVGTFGDFSAFSFQSTKALSLGEGGAVLSKHKKSIETLKLIRSHGMSHEKYYHHLQGHNFRLTSYQAALGRSKLKRFEETANGLRNKFKFFKNLILKQQLPYRFQKINDSCIPVPWGFPILINDLAIKQQIIAQAEISNIEIRPFFKPFWEMPAFNGQNLDHCPVALKLSSEGLIFPLHNMLNEVDIGRMVNVLNLK